MFGKRTAAVAFLLALASAVAAPVTATAAPTVALRSTPPPGDVSGQVTFTATATDLGDPDHPGQLHFYIDGADFTFENCIASPCTSTFRWDPRKLSGTHTVQAVAISNDGQTVKSPVLSFRPYAATHVTKIQVLPPGSAGGKKTVIVSMTAHGKPAPGAPVSITFKPAVGKPTKGTGTTTGDGTATFTHTFTYNTTIAVVGGGNNRWGRSTRSERVTFAPTWSCSFAHATVKHGHRDAITCKVPGLPRGTKVDLAYLAGSKWITLTKGHSGAGKLTLAFTPKKKGDTQLRVRTKGARVYQDSSTTAKVKVT